MSDSDNPSPATHTGAEGFFANSAFLFVAIMALTMAVRMPLLSIPFERDEGEYAYIAWRMDFHELPYRDWVDQKPPGIFWVYRLALALPMDPVRAVHLAGALCAALSAGALFLIARRFLEPFWAAVAGASLGLLSADTSVQGNAANTEIFMLLPLLLSQLTLFGAVSGNGHRKKFMLLCGALVGVACLFKQVAALHWIFLVLVYPLFCDGKDRGRATLAFAAWSAVGAAAVWAGVIVYFLLEHGWHDFLYNVLLHNLDYISALTPADRMSLLGYTVADLVKSQAIIWFFAIVGGAMLVRRRQMQWFVFLLLWLMTSMVGVNVSGYFFPHYFQALLPALALAAVIGAASLEKARAWAAAPAWSRRTALIGALAVLPAVVMLPFLFRYTPKQAVSVIYPGHLFAAMPELGQRLAEVTRPDDRVYVFGSEPELLFYARRASATRYIILFPLFGPYEDAKAKQVATSQEILAARPAAAAYLPNTLFFVPHSEQYLANWSFDYMHKNFQPDRWVGIDPSGACQVLPVIKGAPPPTNMIAELMVRKGGP
jgi:4-amino-4-deoxy-L-arabinose transferase-like glycosyltransferase